MLACLRLSVVVSVPKNRRSAFLRNTDNKHFCFNGDLRFNTFSVYYGTRFQHVRQVILAFICSTLHFQRQT